MQCRGVRSVIHDTAHCLLDVVLAAAAFLCAWWRTFLSPLPSRCPRHQTISDLPEQLRLQVEETVRLDDRPEVLDRKVEADVRRSAKQVIPNLMAAKNQ